MKISLNSTGYCKQREAWSIKGGRWRKVDFHATFAIIEHPGLGLILFDTGYSDRFTAATRHFPFRVYRWATPVYLDEYHSAIEQVKALGYQPGDVRFIILSHFHADHIGGLLDFPDATIICSKAAYESVKDLSGKEAVKQAFLPELIPGDFEERAHWIESSSEVKLAYSPLDRGYDIFGDGTMIAVELPGHAAHQFGVLVQDPDTKPLLLGADASWSLQAIKENRLPHSLAFKVFDDAQDYKKTFQRLVEFHLKHPDVEIIFTHCEETLFKCGGWLEREPK